ncbi:MAG: hypothetical protein MJ246_09025 [Clostridia bacterium]|nr:hypothetical protein [Clostridia bacterium]
MKKWLLALAAILIVAALIGVYFLRKTDDEIDEIKDDEIAQFVEMEEAE